MEQFDDENRTDLVSTLRVYLESFGSVSTAASRLFLHSNTLRHRLARIAEVTGLDLDDPQQRLAVSLLLLAGRPSDTDATPT
jgi:DNA-binding PucR family transcriptional regulator